MISKHFTNLRDFKGLSMILWKPPLMAEFGGGFWWEREGRAWIEEGEGTTCLGRGRGCGRKSTFRGGRYRWKGLQGKEIDYNRF